MGKTRQRKESAYQLGKQDAVNGYGFRWYKHPYMKQYKAGYYEGRRKKKPRKQDKLRQWLKRLLVWRVVRRV